jgi:hypothetical protein
MASNKHGRLGLVIGCWLLFSSAAAWAAAIGAPERTGRLGLGLSYSSFDVHDPDGSVANESDFSLINFFYTDRFVRGYRYWVEGFYQEATFDGSTKDIGQDMERMGLRLAIQHRLDFVTAWDMWGGIGLTAAHDSFTKRFTVDSDGFLGTAYEDRSANHLGMQFDLTSEWRVGQDWDLAVRLLYGFPFGDGVGELGAMVGVLHGF